MRSDTNIRIERIERGVYVPEQIPRSLNIKCENSHIEAAEAICQRVHLANETPEPCP